MIAATLWAILLAATGVAPATLQPPNPHVLVAFNTPSLAKFARHVLPVSSRGEHGAARGKSW